MENFKNVKVFQKMFIYYKNGKRKTKPDVDQQIIKDIPSSDYGNKLAEN